jgi:hypothetical protein
MRSGFIIFNSGSVLLEHCFRKDFKKMSGLIREVSSNKEVMLVISAREKEGKVAPGIS